MLSSLITQGGFIFNFYLYFFSIKMLHCCLHIKCVECSRFSSSRFDIIFSQDKNVFLFVRHCARTVRHCPTVSGHCLGTRYSVLGIGYSVMVCDRQIHKVHTVLVVVVGSGRGVGSGRVSTRYSVLGIRYSVLGTRYSVLGISTYRRRVVGSSSSYSVFGIRYSVLSIRYSVFGTLYSVLDIRNSVSIDPYC